MEILIFCQYLIIMQKDFNRQKDTLTHSLLPCTRLSLFNIHNEMEIFIFCWYLIIMQRDFNRQKIYSLIAALYQTKLI